MYLLTDIVGCFIGIDFEGLEDVLEIVKSIVVMVPEGFVLFGEILTQTANLGHLSCYLLDLETDKFIFIRHRIDGGYNQLSASHNH